MSPSILKQDKKENAMKDNIKKAQKLVDEFSSECNKHKSSLDEVYNKFKAMKTCKLIDSLLKVYEPNVKFKVNGKIVPFFAVGYDKFLGKDGSNYLAVYALYDNDKLRFYCYCNLLVGGIMPPVDYIEDSSDDLARNRLIYAKDELPF